MKFILGYMAGTVCPLDPSRPLVYLILKAAHCGTEYRVERFVRDKDSGLAQPQLQVHDSDDFPPAVINAWLDCVDEDGGIKPESHRRPQIIETDANGRRLLVGI